MGIRHIISFLSGTAGEPALAKPLTVPMPPSIWHRVGMRYNVSRMTGADLRAAADELFAAGAISLPDFRLLALHPDAEMPDWRGGSTQAGAASDSARNWVQALEERIAGHQIPYPVAANYERMLSLLRRIEAARAERQPV